MLFALGLKKFLIVYNVLDAVCFNVSLMCVCGCSKPCMMCVCVCQEQSFSFSPCLPGCQNMRSTTVQKGAAIVAHTETPRETKTLAKLRMRRFISHDR